MKKGNKGKEESPALKGVNQIDPFCLTSYSPQSKSFSDIKHNLEYLNLHVWGYIKIFIFLTMIFNIASMGRNVLAWKTSYWNAIENLP